MAQVALQDLTCTCKASWVLMWLSSCYKIAQVDLQDPTVTCKAIWDRPIYTVCKHCKATWTFFEKIYIFFILNKIENYISHSGAQAKNSNLTQMKFHLGYV